MATDAPELVVPTVEATQPATPTPTPEPTPTPSPTVNVLEQVGDYFGLSADDLGITQAPAATPTPVPTQEAAPTQQVVQILPTATPTQGLSLIHIFPSITGWKPTSREPIRRRSPRKRSA